MYKIILVIGILSITLGCATRGVGRIRIFGNSVGSPFNPSATRFTVMEIAA